MPSEIPVVGPVPGAVSEQDYADMAYHCAAHAQGLDDAIYLMQVLDLGGEDVMRALKQLRERRWER